MSNDGFNLSNTYLWKLIIFKYCEGIKLYKLIINEINRWTPNCHIYNMILGRVNTLLNLSKQEIEKVTNEIERTNVNSLMVSISIMNIAQYLRYSIESIVSQLVNNNIKILSKNTSQINKTWRIKAIFNTLNSNKIDWSIKKFPNINYLDDGEASMLLTKNEKFDPDSINEDFEYLSDMLHAKHLLHEKCKIIHAKTYEEYKEKEMDIFRNDINKLNLIHKNIYEILSNHSLFLENGECVVTVKDFKIIYVLPNSLFFKFILSDF